MSNRPVLTSSIVRSSEDPVAHGLDELWKDASSRYKEETGHEPTFADGFPSKSRNPEEIIDYIVKQSKSIKTSRAVGQKIRRVLRPVVNVVLLFLDAGAEAGSNAAPGGKAIFGAIGVLLQATKGVSGLYDAVEALLEEVTDFFQRASELLNTSAPPTPALTNVLVKTLVQLFIALAIVTKYCSIAAKTESRFKEVMRVILRRTKDYFAVIIGEKDVADALSTLEKLAKTELLTIVTQTYTIARDVQRKADVDRISAWLHPPNHLPNNYQNKRRDDSCEWFFDDKFRMWKDQKDGMYWVSGTAGTGKSVLCSSVIDALKKDAALLVAYFYFDYSDAAKKGLGTSGLLSSLVFQIGTSHDKAFDYLKNKRSSHLPAPSALLDLLSELLKLSGRTFLVIDALDECPEPERVDKGLLDFLHHLRVLQQSDDVDLRVLVASRPEPDIRDRMQHLATHSLSDFQGSREHADEISRYIDSQLFGPESKSSYLGWSDDIKREARSIMIKRSNGMFLWVILVLRYLRHCIAGNVLKVLNELPADLYKTYERILDNFPPSETMIKSALRVFECIAFAKRPLYLDEVVAIFSANISSPNETVVDPALAPAQNDVADSETFILQNCPSLLNIVDSQDGRRIVQFIHFSVKEYLTSRQLATAASSARDYSFDEYSAKLTFARLCIASINLDDLLSGFQSYAAQFWDDHVSSPIVDALHDHSFRFPGFDSSEIFNSWARIQFRRVTQNTSHPSEPIDAVVRARGTHGKTALHIAAQWGRAEASRVLLARGAAVGDAHAYGATPLHFAALAGHYEVVHILIKHPLAGEFDTIATRCSARDGKGRTPLHNASRQGHSDVARILLTHGAPINDADKDGNTSLHDAAYSGHLEVVRILLDHPASRLSDTAALRCGVRDGRGRTALHNAARQGHTEVARILLYKGALVNVADNDGNTPLHDAAAHGHSDIVRILLENPAVDESDTAAVRCRIRNEVGRTALHGAARQGHIEAVRILLDNGALVDDVDYDENTPKALAEREGHPDVILLLSEHSTR